MYNFLKKITKRTIPHQILEKHEPFLRKLISLKYRGNKHQCNICGVRLNRFVTLNSRDLLCPNCGSRSRTRRLFKLITEHETLNGNVLHFSPPKALYKRFKKADFNYYSSDFENEFTADYNYDITSIPTEDNYFDMVICYHVLEHIEDDNKAMSELFRVLKANGLCYIQTPFKDGPIYEDASITAPEEREIAFGQKDHVRVYSVSGLTQRLEQVGFNVDTHFFEEDDTFGLKKETVIIAKKQASV